MTGTGEVHFATAADGTVLQYEVAGAGEPVVFLHGGFASRSAFARQRDALHDEFEVILRDLRGHGGSTCSIPADYAIDTTEVTDLLAILDAEGIERAHLVGSGTRRAGPSHSASRSRIRSEPADWFCSSPPCSAWCHRTSTRPDGGR